MFKTTSQKFPASLSGSWAELTAITDNRRAKTWNVVIALSQQTATEGRDQQPQQQQPTFRLCPTRSQVTGVGVGGDRIWRRHRPMALSRVQNGSRITTLRPPSSPISYDITFKQDVTSAGVRQSVDNNRKTAKFDAMSRLLTKNQDSHRLASMTQRLHSRQPAIREC